MCTYVNIYVHTYVRILGYENTYVCLCKTPVCAQYVHMVRTHRVRHLLYGYQNIKKLWHLLTDLLEWTSYGFKSSYQASLFVEKKIWHTL